VSNEALSCRVGLDWVRNGKLEQSRELWDLWCTRQGEAITCDLATTQFVPRHVPLHEDEWLVEEHRYGTANGGLVLHNDRWMDGTFRFDVVAERGLRDVVTMRFASDPSVPQLDLVDFKASGVQRELFSGDAETIELRVPEYTTTVQMPITVPGMHSTDEKHDAAFRRSLSPKDREAYEQFLKSACNKDPQFKNLDEGAVRSHCKVAPPLDKSPTTTNLTPPQKRCIAEAMVASMHAATRQCLADAGLSSKGREQFFATYPKMFDVDTLAQDMP
jgi:hypothetical protein